MRWMSWILWGCDIFPHFSNASLFIILSNCLSPEQIGIHTKCQLISKYPYEKSVWTKYQRIYFCPGSLLLQG